jgi:deoxyribodipyrimidine photo-lyase
VNRVAAALLGTSQSAGRGPAIWWVRWDLRTHDNPALRAAVAAADQVIPCFILDPVLLAGSGPARRAFLLAGLRALDAELRARGGRLVVRRGNPLTELGRLWQETSAVAVFASPYARRRDEEVGRALPLQLVGAPTVRPPDQLVKATGRPYLVFGAFERDWLVRPLPTRADLLPAPGRLDVPPEVEGLPVPADRAPAEFPAGEAEGLRRLRKFLSGPVARYYRERDRLDLDSTSGLSPYLRFGMVSPRLAAAAAAALLSDPEAGAGARAWLRQLIWRDFYQARLYHPLQKAEAAFRRGAGPPGRSGREAFRAWCEGRTGSPLVDAAMRQLLTTGWMPNRARLVAASFLVRFLLVDWGHGEGWFRRLLVDGELAANLGNWQWVAGIGEDRSPFIRLFDPVRQGRRFDPAGAYIRRRCPELAGLDSRWVHAPWEAESPPASYPRPMVDPTWAGGRPWNIAPG